MNANPAPQPPTPDTIELSEASLQQVSNSVKQDLVDDATFTAIATALMPASTTPLAEAFPSIQTLVESYIDDLPDNEKDIVRQRYYHLMTETIRETVQNKITELEAKKTALDTAATALSTAVATTEASYLKAIAILTVPGASPLPREHNLLIALFAKLNTPATILLQTPADLNADKQSITTHLQAVSTHFMSTLPAATPPVVPAGIQTLIDLIGSSTQPINDYLAVHSSQCDPASPDYNAIQRNVQTLQSYHARFQATQQDLIESRDERFTHTQLETDPTNPDVIQFWHPKRTPNANTPYTKLTEFAIGDYANYYQWALAHSDRLTSEQTEAITDNAKVFHSNSLAPDLREIIASFNALIAGGGGGLSVSDFKGLVQNNITNYLNGVIHPPLNGIYANPHNPTATPDPEAKRVSLYLAAKFYKLDIATKTNKQIAEAVQQHLVSVVTGTLNLPTASEQQEFLEDNRLKYTQERTAINRRNLLDTTKAKVQVALEEQFKDKDLSDPTVALEFKKTASRLVLQERLNTLQCLTKPSSERWHHNLTSKLGINGKKFMIGSGLLGLAGLGLGISKGFAGVGTFFSGLGGKIASVLPTQFFTPALKGLSSITAGIGSYILMGQCFDFFKYGPFSNVRNRERGEIIGSRDQFGNNVGGLGRLDTRAGIYDFSTVQTELTAHIKYARQKGATLATNHEDKDLGLISGAPDSLGAKFKTADYLWEREQSGIQAIIGRHIADVQNDATVPVAEKNNTTIARALDALYNPRAIEDNFLASLESSNTAYRRSRTAASTAFGASVTYMFSNLF